MCLSSHITELSIAPLKLTVHQELRANSIKSYKYLKNTNMRFLSVRTGVHYKELLYLLQLNTSNNSQHLIRPSKTLVNKIHFAAVAKKMEG